MINILLMKQKSAHFVSSAFKKTFGVEEMAPAIKEYCIFFSAKYAVKYAGVLKYCIFFVLLSAEKRLRDEKI